MRSLPFLLLFCGVCGCTAMDKAAFKDCAAKALPRAVIGTVAVCGVDDKACLEHEAERRAIAAAVEIDNCMGSLRDASQD
jgi:hypothetical protein